MPLSIEITTKPFVKADTEWKCNSGPHVGKNIGFYNGIPVVFQHFINNRFLVEVGRAKVPATVTISNKRSIRGRS